MAFGERRGRLELLFSTDRNSFAIMGVQFPIVISRSIFKGGGWFFYRADRSVFSGTINGD